MQTNNDQYTFQNLPIGDNYISLLFENATGKYYTESLMVDVRIIPPGIPGYSIIVLVGISIIASSQIIVKKGVKK